MTHTSWHLWLVGIVSLLWNAIGVFDYWATMTEYAPYMSAFTPEQLEFFYGFPSWLYIVWGIATIGSVLGSILLLLRNGMAVMAFFVSLIAMVVTSIQNFLFDDMIAVIGTEALIFSGIIFIVALFLYLYSRQMKRNGVLS